MNEKGTQAKRTWNLNAKKQVRLTKPKRATRNIIPITQTSSPEKAKAKLMTSDIYTVPTASFSGQI